MINNKVPRLHAKLLAVCPIFGVSVPTVGTSVGVRIDFDPIATSAQRTAALSALAVFDWSDAADLTYLAQVEKARAASGVDGGQLQAGTKDERLVVALGLVMLDEINLIRANFTPAMTARTLAQLVTAVKAKIAAMPE